MTCGECGKPVRSRWLPFRNPSTLPLVFPYVLGGARSRFARNPCVSGASQACFCGGVQIMIPIFERYTTDPSKWVRQAAFQHLGPFIATLTSAQVTSSLLKHYIDMASAQDDDDKSDAFDPDMPAYCAFSFPAVAVTIGKDRWPEISGLFHTLARDQQRKVRKPMAHSLHEVNP
jgi:hypothetical protein